MGTTKPVTPSLPKPTADVSHCDRSTFTVSFAVEIVNLEIWGDHKDGWLEVGPPLKSMKLSCQLYYGQTFDTAIVIYEQVAKVSCGPESCWVRTWQFLERRWLTFSIRHAFPVRAVDLRNFDLIIDIQPETSGGGGGGKAQGNQVFFSPLEFGQRRYFGDIIETIPTEKETFKHWIREWIWELLLDYIPPSFLDGRFNIPYPVKDIRHQDTIMCKIQEEIFNSMNEVVKEIVIESPTQNKAAKAKKPVEKKSYYLSLSGDTLLAGSGRLVAFEPVGERPPEIGVIMAIIGSANLPAQDDVPVVFINVDNLFDAPLEEFRKLHITHLYTRWTLGEEVHDSKRVEIESIKQLDVKFNDSHALPLIPINATGITANFFDNPYNIELRGMIDPLVADTEEGILFGYDRQDRYYGTNRLPELQIEEEQQDFVIAITKIDARALARGLNSFIRGEYSLYPLRPSVQPLLREGACTNDINLIRAPLKPKLIVPGSLILVSQMTLEVSMGVVGCKPPKITSCFSRLFCIVSDPNSIMAILLRVRNVNDELADQKPNEMLTGFALDTGDVVILYLEGPRDGNILKIWDMTEEYYPRVKPVFSTSARYSTRIYPEFLKAIMPFIVLKLHAPLALMLACPSVYARPALPIPARIAALKFGRLMQHRYRNLPPRCELPTAAELRSFRLELCAPPRTYPAPHTGHDKEQPRTSITSHRSNKSNIGSSTAVNVNWERN